MGRKCGVEGCFSDSNRPEDNGVTFHKVPRSADLRPNWFSLCRIPEEKKNKVIYVCSRHFLRADFCNFKGKRYMLKQGVFPSVFPWDKSKLEELKSNTKKEVEKVEPVPIKEESDKEASKASPKRQKSTEIKEDALDAATLKEGTTEKKEKTEKIKTTVNGTINFAINSKLEALDNNAWYPARVVEEDFEENEVLIHFEESNKHDEWICMDSPRLRPLQSDANSVPPSVIKKPTIFEKYKVGDRCLACWKDSRKFPATVKKVLEDDTYEVLFDDGYLKVLKAHRMSRSEGRPMQSSPLFDPIQSSKQERRDKKRKINIAELFGKRPRLETSEEKSKPLPPTQTQPDDAIEAWIPQWEGDKPVGVEATIEANDGTRKSFIVPDPRIPKGWAKHLTQRTHGVSAGKWESIIVGPDNRRFRTRNEIKAYLEETKLMKYNPTMFDFGIYRHRTKKKEPEEAKEQIPEVKEEPVDYSSEVVEEEEKNCLKIPIVDNAFQCPIEGCGKMYRKENLAQMHVKHYHPEYTKFLDSTPNVADLAYARTVGESLDKSPGVKITPAKPPVPKTGAKTAKFEEQLSPKNKDSEIVKLLNKREDDVKPLPTGLPANMYPDIKLKDLLNKSEGIPPLREDLNLRTLSSTRPPTGIKTLLPVIRPEKKEEETFGGGSRRLKRKRGLFEAIDSPKGNHDLSPRDIPNISSPTISTTTTISHTPQETTAPPSNDIIIEGGQVIKIVRMKQEEIINCTCGFTEEDGLMIQCDLCLCWQHAFCNNIERESQVPEKYICYICQNPARQRMSKKYFHDQDWLKHGVLPTTSFHTKDEEALAKRFDKLKKSHDVSGGLVELKQFVDSLKVKLKIAEEKNHPKLYLWSKPWEKLPLPEKEKIEPKEEVKTEQKPDDSMLMMILKSAKEEDLNLEVPNAPQPEAPIDSADCRLNLLDHIAHSQSLVDERLDDFERQINELEDASFEDDLQYPKSRQTLNMLLHDLNTLHELSQLTTL